MHVYIFYHQNPLQRDNFLKGSTNRSVITSE